MRLGFLASHNGSSMRAIVAAARDGRLAVTPIVVVSNNAGSPALTGSLAAHHVSASSFGSPAAADAAMLQIMNDAAVDLVVLSGYMRKVGPLMLERFERRILNVHPALLPRFGGPGMYGGRVHAAVLASGATESGATIHLVDAEYDHGRVLAQQRVPVLPGDTVESLAQRVGAIEPGLYIQTLQRIVAGELEL